MEKGDEAYVVGLQKRTDLNGKAVNLLEWNEATGRWSARCQSGAREGICVKPSNLSAMPPLEAVIEEAFNMSVRGGGIMSSFSNIGVVPGQVSYLLFTAFVLEACGHSISEDLLTARLIEHIGKFGDSRLVYDKLRKVATEATDMSRFGIRIPTKLSMLVRMDTAKNMLTLMMNCRMGTIAHLRSQQAHLRRLKSKVGEVKVVSDNPFHAAIRKMCGKEGSKSMSPKQVQDELGWAGMGGDVTILGEEGIEKVTFNEMLHRGYVGWLVEYVLPTLEPRDVKDGSLGKWHQILHWESQLTSSIFVTRGCMFLDISDDFSIGPWLDGLVSFDLKTLEAMPGVDTDRRILRLFFFVEIAFKAALVALDEHKRGESCQTAATPPTDIANNSESSSSESQAVTFASLQEGSKVVVANIPDGDDTYGNCVHNGMQGRVKSIVEDGEKYMVSFSNLESVKEVLGIHLARSGKVEREKHACRLCCEDADYVCVECNMAWYCSPKCQRVDYKNHKKQCQVLSHENMFDAMRAIKGFPEEDYGQDYDEYYEDSEGEEERDEEDEDEEGEEGKDDGDT